MKTIEFADHIKIIEKYDVVIAGGGTAGVCAAVSAARNGAKVCLIEQSSMLGGLGTSGMMTVIIAPKRFFGGIGKEIIDGLKARDAIRGYEEKTCVWAPYQNEAMKSLLDDMVTESNVSLYLYTKVIGVAKVANRIRAVVLSGPEGNFAVEGQVYIDATGDGILSCFSGEDWQKGDESGNTQAPTMVAYYGDIDFEKRNQFVKENGGSMDQIIHSLLPRAVREGVIRVEDMHHPGAYRVGENYAVANCGHIYGADCTTAKGLTDATVEGRKIAKEYFEFYRKYIPGFENAVFFCTAAWLGIRETRRITGRYICRYDDKINYRKFDDAVLRYEGGPSTDIHSSTSSKEDYDKFHTIFKSLETDEKKRNDWAEIPYRALLAGKTDNLLIAGRCLSADRFVNGHVRTMGYCMMMGQAAGTAAALCAKDQAHCDRVDMTRLQMLLAQDGILRKND